MPLRDDQLTPTQRATLTAARDRLARGAQVCVTTRDGCGRSTLLELIAGELGAPVIRLADIVAASSEGHPLQLEEGFMRVVLGAFADHDAVVVDDVHTFFQMFAACRGAARPSILPLVFDALKRTVESSGKKLVIGVDERLPFGIESGFLRATMERFDAGDLAAMLAVWFPDAPLDAQRIYRFAPRLTGHQVRFAAQHLESNGLDTDAFIEFLEKHALVSNVDVGAVQQVSFGDLYGVDDVIRSLEIDVTNPLENPELAETLGLEAKKGVLLYGPPGTGKTSIGRALAHRLGSKFFLIDGTVISGTQNFFGRIHSIFKAAVDNAPSVLFIDDSDVLFETGGETALYRYLLTMLDGLESERDGHVTLILTAMNIASLPPALIRSGRVELWLQMRLPDEAARAAIAADRLAACAAPLCDADPAAIAAATESLTGADIKRVIADAVNLHGYDVAAGEPKTEPLRYIDQALERLRELRDQLAAAPPVTSAHYGTASHPGVAYAMDLAYRRAERDAGS